MNHFIILSFFIFTLFYSIEGFAQPYEKPIRELNPQLGLVIDSAKYDVDNVHIYYNENEFLYSVISTKGVYQEQRYLKNKDKKFIISGSNNGYRAEYLVYLDHPLPKLDRISQTMYTIYPGSDIRVFGILTGLEDFIYPDGTVKKLPVLEAIMIFKLEDRYYKYPVWVNSSYQNTK